MGSTEIDAKYQGVWEAMDVGPVLTKGAKIHLHGANYQVDGGTHGVYTGFNENSGKTGITVETAIGSFKLKEDGTGTVTDPTKAVSQTLQRIGAIPPPKESGDSKGDKSDNTAMALILGLAIVGLFGFNKVF